MHDPPLARIHPRTPHHSNQTKETLSSIFFFPFSLFFIFDSPLHPPTEKLIFFFFSNLSHKMAKLTWLICMLLFGLSEAGPLDGKVFFSTPVGVWMAASGEDPVQLTSFDTDAEICGTKAVGLDVDTTTGWVVISCGTDVFTATVLLNNLTPARLPVMQAVDLQIRSRVNMYHGVAIDTNLQIAYVASFEVTTVPLWSIRAISFKGCEEFGTDADACEATRTCRVSLTSGVCIKDGSYSLFQVQAADAVSGGLWSDDNNVIWLSHIDQNNIGTVTNQALETVPGVSTHFTEGYETLELGYPFVVGKFLYILGMDDAKSELLRFPLSGSAKALVVLSNLPTQKGSVVGQDSAIRQPSFGLHTVDTNGVRSLTQLAYVSGDAVVSSKCSSFTCISSTKDLALSTSIGPIVYRDPRPTGETDAPPTAQPTSITPSTDTPIEPNVTDSSSSSPSESDAPTMEPTDAPPGSTIAPLKDANESTAEPCNCDVSGGAGKEEDCDEGFSGVAIALAGIAGYLIGAVCGWVASKATKKKQRRFVEAEESHAQLEELVRTGCDDESVGITHAETHAESVKAANSSNPDLPLLNSTTTSAIFAPIGESQTSHCDLIQDCSFSEGHKFRDRLAQGEMIERLPAGIRQPSPQPGGALTAHEIAAGGVSPRKKRGLTMGMKVEGTPPSQIRQHRGASVAVAGGYTPPPSARTKI